MFCMTLPFSWIVWPIIASIHLKWLDEFIEEISVFVRVVVLYIGYWILLYINLSVTKNCPFYVQDIWKVRSCKTCISTLLTINLQAKTHHTHPQLLFLHIKRDTDCCGFALFFRGLASCEWNGQQATITYIKNDNSHENRYFFNKFI
jgi:hypothetical protein